MLSFFDKKNQNLNGRLRIVMKSLRRDKSENETKKKKDLEELHQKWK